MGQMLAELPTDRASGPDAEPSPLVTRFATEATGTAHGIVDVACNVRELSLRMAAQESLLSGVEAKMTELGQENSRIVASAEASRQVAEVTGAELVESLDVVRRSIGDVNDLVQYGSGGARAAAIAAHCAGQGCEGFVLHRGHRPADQSAGVECRD